MNRAEAGQLLGIIALGDNRSTDDAMAVYWQNLLPDIRIQDALEAVAIHRRESTAWLQPAHIVHLVQKIRAQRIDAANIVYEPIGNETARQVLDRIAATYRAAGDGRLDPRTIGRALEPGRTAPDVPAEVESAIQARKAIRSALTIRCPFCKAAPRSPCKVGRNANGKATFAHPARTEAVRALATRTENGAA